MRLAIPILTVMLAASTASAEDSPFTDPGFYLGAGGVYATDIFESEVDDFVEDSFGVPVSVDIDPTWGANARFGYRFGGWFATEIQYEWIDEFDIDLSVVGIPAGGASLGGHTLTLNGKLIAPIWRTQPYLLAGIGGSRFHFEDHTPFNLLGGSSSKTGVAGRAGLGIDFHLTHHLVLNTEATLLLTTQDFERPGPGDLDDLYYVSASVGLRYRF